MDRDTTLGSEGIGKLLFKFSVPAIIGMLVNALYNVVDTMYIGNIKGSGSIALAGVAVTLPISIIIMAFGMLVGIGSSAMISIRLGENRKNEAEKILGNAFMLDIIMSSLVGIIGIIFLDKILSLFSISPSALPYAKEYISIILIGAPLQNIGFGINNIIRSEGNPKRAMITMLIGAGLNIILDPIFIFPFGLGMGVKGAAIATVISEAVSSILVVSYFLWGKSVLKIHKKYLTPDFKIIRDIFSIGMSPFSMQIAASIVTSLYNQGLLTYGGDKAVAAMSIINRIAMLIFMPMFGINQGVQPIIGYNYGDKNYTRVKKAVKLAIFAAVTIGCVGFIMVEVFPKYLVMAFNREDAELLNIAVFGMRVDLIFLPVIAFQIISSNYFQAIGKAKISILLSLSRQVLILIPLIIVLPLKFGLNGLWFSAPIADILSATLTAYFLIRSIRGLNEMEANLPK